jgi:hypothetical protein
VAISLVYWICAGARAAHRPFWFDELETWYLARMPSIPAIWKAMCAGADQNVILSHLSVRLSHTLFGSGPLATRLPALFGFWIMFLCVYVFLRRRLPDSYAFIGMALPMITLAWKYAFEARAYGIWMGAAAFALVSWQAAAENRLRPLSLIGVTAGLTAALASHPVAVLLAIPFGLGEVARSVKVRRVDIPMWIAFAAAIPVTFAYYPLIAVPRSFDIHGLHPGLSGIPEFYSAMFRAAIAPMVMAGVAVFLLVRPEWKYNAMEPLLPYHESVALVGFTIAPVALLVAGTLLSGISFVERYGLFCVIGAASWVAVLIFRAAGGHRRIGIVFSAALVGWLLLARGREAAASTGDPGTEFRANNPLLVEALASGYAVVANDPLVFLPADFYLPTSSLANLYHVVELSGATQYVGQDASDRQMLIMARQFPIRAHIEYWASFAARHPRFLLLVNEPQRQRIYDLLMNRGAWRLTLWSHRGNETLYEVNSIAEDPRPRQ